MRSVKLNEKKRRLAFTPGITGKMEIVVYEAGADTDRQLGVARSSVGKVKSGVIRGINVKRGVRMALEIELDTAFGGAMKVAAHEI